MNYLLELRRIIITLNDVEVKGKGNMDRLLGSVIHLERMASDTQANEQRGRAIQQCIEPLWICSV